MGSFSWLRAEVTTHRANITWGDKYKILVPKEFGGGYIQDIYTDYGHVFSHDDALGYSKYIDGEGNAYNASEFKSYDVDLYGILAWWNAPDDLDFVVPDDVSDDNPDETERLRPKTMYDILLRGLTDEARYTGIDIGCDDEQIDMLKYPLKLVSENYQKSYEQCTGRSYSDPDQGFGASDWDDDEWYLKYKHRLIDTLKKNNI